MKKPEARKVRAKYEKLWPGHALKYKLSLKDMAYDLSREDFKKSKETNQNILCESV